MSAKSARSLTRNSPDLTKAFFLGGIENCTVTDWQVDDAYVAELAKEFYKQTFGSLTFE